MLNDSRSKPAAGSARQPQPIPAHFGGRFVFVSKFVQTRERVFFAARSRVETQHWSSRDKDPGG